MQPVDGSHESDVHALSSLQSAGEPPAQMPAAQTSPTVQALPSAHDGPVFAVSSTQSASTQVSAVQGSPSSQSGQMKKSPSSRHEGIPPSLTSPRAMSRGDTSPGFPTTRKLRSTTDWIPVSSELPKRAI